MGGVAFLFGGPGLAAPGMGKDLYNKAPLVRESLDKADKVLLALGGVKPTKACFAGSAELLNRPSVAAPALLALAHGVFRTLRAKRILPQCSAGLGWGAWVALAAQGSVDYEAALRLLHAFGLACEAAWEAAPWWALAQQGLPVAALEERAAAQGAPLRRLALLSPEQAVFGGDQGVLRLLHARFSGLGRAVQVGPVEPGWQWPDAAFAEAAEGFARGLPPPQELEPLPASLVLGEGSEAGRQPRDWLPVLAQAALRTPDWPAVGRKLRLLGADTVVELGHGSGLGAALRAADPGLRALSTENAQALAQTFKLSQQ